MGHVFQEQDPCFFCGQITRLGKGRPCLGSGKYSVGAQSTVAHKRISPPHKDSGLLLSLTRSTKRVTFVCLSGRRGCVTTVQAGERGGGRGDTGGSTVTEGVDEVKAQGWPSLFVTASSFTERLCSSPMGRLVFIYFTVSLHSQTNCWWLHRPDPFRRLIVPFTFLRINEHSKRQIGFPLKWFHLSHIFFTFPKGCQTTHYEQKKVLIYNMIRWETKFTWIILKASSRSTEIYSWDTECEKRKGVLLHCRLSKKCISCHLAGEGKQTC